MVSRVLSDSNTPAAAANSTNNSPQIQEAVIDWMIDNALNQKAVTFSQEDFQNYSSISSSSKSKTSASSNSNSMMVEIIDICDSDDDDDQVNNSLKNQVSQVNQFEQTKNKTTFSKVLPVQQTTVNQPTVFRKILPANLRGNETKPDLITKNDSTNSYSSSFSLNCSDENSQILSTLFATLSSRETSYSPSTTVKSNTTNESTTNFAVNKLTYANKVPDKLIEPTSTIAKPLLIQPTKPFLSPFQPLIERSQKLDQKMGTIMQKFSIKNFSDEQVKRKLGNVTPEMGIKKLKSSPDSSLSSIDLSSASNVSNQQPSTKLNPKSSSTNRTKSLSFFGALAFQAREILTEVTKNVTSSTSLHSEPKSSTSSISQPIVFIESSKSLAQKSSKLPITITSEIDGNRQFFTTLNQKLSDEQASQALPTTTSRTRPVSTALQVPQAKTTTPQIRPASPATQALPSSQADQAKTTISHLPQTRSISPVIQTKPSSHVKLVTTALPTTQAVQAPQAKSSFPSSQAESTSHVKLASPAIPTTQAVQAPQVLPSSQAPKEKPSTKTQSTSHVKLASPALPTTQAVQAPQAKPSTKTKTRPTSHVKLASPALPTTEVVQAPQAKSSSPSPQAEPTSQVPQTRPSSQAKSSQALQAKSSTKTKTRSVSPVIQAKSSSPAPQAEPTSQVPLAKPSTETQPTCDVKLESPSASCSLVNDTTDIDNNSESLYVRSKREREKLLASAFQSVYAKSTTKRGSSFYNNLIV